jgi:hypothetical protein
MNLLIIILLIGFISYFYLNININEIKIIFKEIFEQKIKENIKNYETLLNQQKDKTINKKEMKEEEKEDSIINKKEEEENNLKNLKEEENNIKNGKKEINKINKETQVEIRELEQYYVRKELTIHNKRSIPSISVLMDLPSNVRYDNNVKQHREWIKNIMKEKREEKVISRGIQVQIESREMGISSQESIIIEEPKYQEKTTKKRQSIIKSEEQSKHVMFTEIKLYENTMIPKIYESIQHIIYEKNKNRENYNESTSLLNEVTTKKDIDLKNTPLITIPIQFIEENNIHSLILSNCQLSYIPNWFFENLKNIILLDLSRNYLFELPNNLSNLKKLNELDISNNNFEYLPESLFYLNNLTILKVNNNKLKIIPSEIQSIQYLTFLDISFNHLFDIPDGLYIFIFLKKKKVKKK